MKILICTQKVDASDPTLGFFCTWIAALAGRFETVSVICLEEGEHSLPRNVTVYSLGKSSAAPHVGKLTYAWNFYRYLSLIKGQYDKVFVHMNQEYMLLGGLYWKARGIPAYLWRNHPHGDVFTRFAIVLSTKVFCTSADSFTARFGKTVLMPAGIDTGAFKDVPGSLRSKNSIAVIGRIAPVKNIHLALQALKILIESGSQVSMTIVGSPLPRDAGYAESLRQYAEDNALQSYVHFREGVSPDKLPEIYSSHDVCLNLTVDGSFDKTIVEAAACGAMPVVSNQSLRGLLPDACLTSRVPEEIAFAITQVLSGAVRAEVSRQLGQFVESQSLDALVKRLEQEMKKHVQE
jgi:glycosyltransferase involved in cell wall biosynthesis